jgi:hypothetical protein
LSSVITCIQLSKLFAIATDDAKLKRERALKIRGLTADFSLHDPTPTPTKVGKRTN